jgi:type I restriction enzyme S subunit
MTWQTKKLIDVFNIKPSKSEVRKQFGSKDMVSFVPMEDLGMFKKEFGHHKTRKFNEVVNNYTYFAENDVLLAKITPCFENGKLGIAKNLANGVGFGSSEFVVFRSKSEVISEYLFYFLSSDEFRETGRKLMSGAVGHKRIPKEFIDNYPISFPSIIEQRSIVKKLDEVFENIEKAEKNTEKNLQNSRELFESYLQLVFAKNNWETKTLKDVAVEFGRGKSKHRPRNDKSLFNGKYPFIQTGDIRNSNHYITKYSQTYNEVGLNQSKLWPKGTICITIAANIAETGILTFDACFPDSVIGFIVNDRNVTSEFAEYLLESFKVKIQAKGKGSAQANINLATFEHELFPFPELSEQKSIVQKLDSLSEQTKKLEENYKRKLVLLDELKKSVLAKAFRGEW